MSAGPTLREIPFENSVLRAYTRPAVVRARSTDLADALGIPRVGNWALRVSREMRRRPHWRGPILIRWPDGSYRRGYERIDEAPDAE